SSRPFKNRLAQSWDIVGYHGTTVCLSLHCRQAPTFLLRGQYTQASPTIQVRLFPVRNPPQKLDTLLQMTFPSEPRQLTLYAPVLVTSKDHQPPVATHTRKCSDDLLVMLPWPDRTRGNDEPLLGFNTSQARVGPLDRKSV